MKRVISIIVFLMLAGMAHGENLQDIKCSDDDGGKNYYVLGNATGAAYTGEVNTINDGCIIGGLHDGWLREAVCEGNVATWSDYKCSSHKSFQRLHFDL